MNEDNHVLSNSPADRADAVKREAAMLGFDACGIAAAEPIDPDDRLGAWLALGYQAGMDWMVASKAVRQDIRLRLPGAQSVVVVARNYYAERPSPPPHSGRVSRYGWGRDYHRVLRKPLRRLARFLDSLEPEAESYGCIDSGPVLEKFWAAQAGIGWIGKNTLILRRGMGSYFFLAVLATTVKLVPDTPVSDGCGTCRACLDACPTGAIVTPYVLDSNRCISYHTIENRDAIPDTVAEHMGDWVFGCDICQDVCPWNRKVSITDATDFHPRPHHANPPLDWFDRLTEEAFREHFAGTPILRAKHAGMRRNAAIVRDNQPDAPSGNAG